MSILSDKQIDALPKIMTTQPVPRPSAVAEAAYRETLKMVKDLCCDDCRVAILNKFEVSNGH